VTICASFDNHGGLNESAVNVTHFDNDSNSSNPTSLLKTVDFIGSLPSATLTRIGQTPRRDTSFDSTMALRGQLTPSGNVFRYRETLLNRHELLGEMQGPCHRLDDP
jgi:hypothetical protein